MITIGIDAGQTGGLAALNEHGQLLSYIRMPVLQVGKKKAFDLRIAHYWLQELGLTKTESFEIVLEQVHAMPRQGVSSSFQFGRMYGGVEAWAIGTGAPVHQVTPSVWKKAMRLSSNKKLSMDTARLRFGVDPVWDVLRNDGIAEAALLAAYWQDKRT